MPRAVPLSSWVGYAIARTRLPPGEAGSIIAHRDHTEPVLPRRSISTPNSAQVRRTLPQRVSHP